MPSVSSSPLTLFRPTYDRQAYRLKFRVRVPLGVTAEHLEIETRRALDTINPILYSQGWTFAGGKPRCIGGPFPVNDVRGFPRRRPSRVGRLSEDHTPSPPDPTIPDALGRVSDALAVSPGAPVEWEYEGLWQRPAFRTEYMAGG